MLDAFANNKKYLSIDERVELIKQIKQGDYIIKNKKGQIVMKQNKELFTKSCDILDLLRKIADVKDIGKGSYGQAYNVCMPKSDCLLHDEDSRTEKTLIIEPKTFNYSVKEITFKNSGTYNPTIDNPDRYENVELRMLFLLSEFVFSGATPHINLPIASFLCLSDTKHVKRYTISETAALGNMHRFVNKYLKKYTVLNATFWKVLFFQILSTLTVIQKVYPNFLHNDLKPNNILVRPTKKYQKLSSLQKESFKYTVNGKDFYIPDLGFQILLWDFDFGAIAGHIDNDKLIYMIDDDANLTMHKNQYYDIRMLFGLMHRYWSSQMPVEVESWISDYVISKRLKASDHDERLLEAVEYTTPAKLLQSDFFKEFRLNDEQLTKQSSKIIDSYTGELNGSIRFNFEKELNRYTNPKSCAYKNFVFFDPKKPTQEEKELFANRYKCTLASSMSRGIQTYYIDGQMENISKWINDVLSTIISNNMITKREMDKIVEYTVELLKKFIELYHVPINYLYCVLAAIMMYASYAILLSYEKPFNKFAWWYQNEKLKEFDSGIIEDTFKQICDFVAKHIE